MATASKYDKTVDKIIAWSEQDHNIESVIIIGSQIRKEKPADEWSDLDLMVLTNESQILLHDNNWLNQFGIPVCTFIEETVLSFVKWNWIVKRVLFDDNRDIDFSILPYDQIDDVLAINKAIISKGYQVIYDSKKPVVNQKIQSLLKNRKNTESQMPFQTELCNDINDILYHVVWIYKKIQRKELFVAVTTINSHINNLLLKLIEILNKSETSNSNSITYEGRFLEERTDRAILNQFQYCFCKYDEEDAVETLSWILDFTYSISKQIFMEKGYNLNNLPFDRIRKIYTEMTGYP